MWKMNESTSTCNCVAPLDDMMVRWVASVVLVLNATASQTEGEQMMSERCDVYILSFITQLIFIAAVFCYSNV